MKYPGWVLLKDFICFISVTILSRPLTDIVGFNVQPIHVNKTTKYWLQVYISLKSITYKFVSLENARVQGEFVASMSLNHDKPIFTNKSKLGYNCNFSLKQQ